MDTSFQKTMASDEWGTPREIVDALGVFDLDPCATKENSKGLFYFNKEEDGLKENWFGRLGRLSDYWHLVKLIKL